MLKQTDGVWLGSFGGSGARSGGVRPVESRGKAPDQRVRGEMPLKLAAFLDFSIQFSRSVQI